MAERSRLKVQPQERSPQPAPQTGYQPAAGVLGLQRAAGNRAVDGLVGAGDSGESPPFVQQVAQDGGQPLDAQTRTEFEAAFGQDLGRVRVHTGRRAAASARFIGAQAYTSGRHVVFGRGEYAPNTPSGRDLLGHELAHVIQMGGQGGTDLARPGDRWELEAGTPGAPLTAAPAAVRMKLDPNLGSYMEKLKALAKEPDLAKLPMEKAADRIATTLSGLDIMEEETLIIVVEELNRLFPERVVSQFLVRIAATPVKKSEISPEGRAMQRTLKQMEIKNPYKTLHTVPGSLGIGLGLSILDNALKSAAAHAPPELLNAVSNGQWLVDGVYSGMSELIGDEELEALTDKLSKSQMLSVAFPQVFMAGAALGIGEDVVDFVKSIKGLFEGELGDLIYVAMEAAKIMMSKEGAQVSFEFGKQIGRGWAADLLEALRQNLVHFTFTLGRKIGPAIVYTALSLSGAVEPLLASVSSKIFPVLKTLLKNEARLLKILKKIEDRMPKLPAKKVDLPGPQKLPPAKAEIPDNVYDIRTGKPLKDSPDLPVKKGEPSLAEAADQPGVVDELELMRQKKKKATEQKKKKKVSKRTADGTTIEIEVDDVGDVIDDADAVQAMADKPGKPKSQPGQNSPPGSSQTGSGGGASNKSQPAPQSTPAKSGEPGPKTLDERKQEAQKRLNQKRKEWREYNAEREAEGRSKKGGPSKGFWNEKEQIWLLERQKAYPNRQLLDQARIVGVKEPNGVLTKAADIAEEGRTLDFLEIDGKKVLGGDLKSAETLKESFAGGLKKSTTVEGKINPNSKLGKQLDKEKQILDSARKSGGKLVIEGKDVMTGKTITREVELADFESRVFTYDDVYPN